MLRANLFKLLAVLFTCLAAAGCKKTSIISGIDYEVRPNLETVKVAMNFANNIKTDLGGSFTVKDYGTLDVTPWTPTNPFSVGFTMNTNVLNDQDYVNFTPTTVLPNGDPLPIAANRAYAQVKLENPINKNFDVYAYVDAYQHEWFGVAVLLNVINDKYFPAGLTITTNFLKDKVGNARGVGAFFGPAIDSNGKMTKSGGIAFFANIKALVAAQKANVKANEKRANPYLFSGTMASYYKSSTSRQSMLQTAIVEAMNGNLK